MKPPIPMVIKVQYTPTIRTVSFKYIEFPVGQALFFWPKVRHPANRYVRMCIIR